MFKKFMCLALSIMMVFCTVSTTGFAASHETDNLVVSHVTFTADGKATVNIANVGEVGSDSQDVVFWIGEYVNDVLVESDFERKTLAAGETTSPDLEVSVTKDEGSVLKAYVWKDIVGGKPLAPAATYPSSNTEILYAEKDGEAWAEFNAETLTYSIELERTNFDIPQFDFYAKDNGTQIIEPETYAVGENKVVVKSSDGTELAYAINIKYQAPTISNVKSTSEKLGVEDAYKLFDANDYRDPGYGEDRALLKNGGSLDFKKENYDSDDQWREVANTVNYVSKLLLEDGYGEDAIKATSMYKSYPASLSMKENSTTGVITTTVNITGGPIGSGWFKKGEVNWNEPFERGYVFPVSKGLYPSQTDAGQYTKGEILTFEINHPGTFYFAVSGGAISYAASEITMAGTGFEKLSGISISNASVIYAKHFEPGVVSIPGLNVGWTGGYNNDGNRTADNSGLYFVFDKEGYDQPIKFDSTDATLKALSFKIAETETPLDLTGGEKTFNIDVPTGTTKIDAVVANKNVSYATIDGVPVDGVALVDGEATVVITVTSFDGTATETYTINFKEIPPVEDDATLKSISYSYKVGEEDATEADVEGFNSATEVYNVDLPEGATEVVVSAQASVGNDKAIVEITQATFADYKGTATILVTAIDGTTKKTYTVNFEIPVPIYEKPNKIYDLKATTGTVKAVDNSYMTEEEVLADTISYIAIGEGLFKGYHPFYENKSTVTAVTDDMLGASWLRARRNFSFNSQKVDSIDRITVAGEVVYENGEYKNGYTAETSPVKVKDNVSIGNGAGANEFRWYGLSDTSDAKKSFGSAFVESGIYRFKVTSDCTVVIADYVNKEYPGLVKYNAETAPDGWKKSTGNANKLNSDRANYYKEFKAGDEVIIPGYDIEKYSGWDSREVVVDYTRSDKAGSKTVQLSEFDIIPWDTIAVAVKWDVTLSDDATLSDIKVNGETIADFDPEKTDYVVTVPSNVDSVTLAATPTDAKATVECPATVVAGGKATIVVTAENGAEKEYTVTIEKEDAADAKLSALSYKIDGADAVAVADFDAAVEGGEYNVALDYAENGVTVSLVAEKGASNQTVTYDADSVNVDLENPASITVTVKSGDATNIKTYKVNFTMKEFEFKISNLVSKDGNTEIPRIMIEAAPEKVNYTRAKLYGIGYSPSSAAVLEKKAEFQSYIDAVNVKYAHYGENAVLGTSLLGGNYPCVSVEYGTKGDDVTTETEVVITLDNPIATAPGYKSLGAYTGRGYTLRAIKGGTPKEGNLGVFGTDPEFITFDINAPGKMYIGVPTGKSHPGAIAAGYELVNGLYVKSFPAGKVSVPAWGLDESQYEIGVRQASTPYYFFIFDDPDAPAEPPVLSNVAELEKISYKVGDADAVEVTEIADAITIEIPEYTGDIVVTGVAASNGTVAPATIAVENGVGSGKLVVTAEDGKTTKEYTIKFELEEFVAKITNIQHADYVIIDDKATKVIDEKEYSLNDYAIEIPYGTGLEYTRGQDAADAVFAQMLENTAALGEGGYLGASFYQTFPNSTYANGKAYTWNKGNIAKADTSAPGLFERGYTIKVSKGANIKPSENYGIFRQDDDMITFDINAPGTVYVVDMWGNGYKGGTDAGFEKSDYTINSINGVGSPVYEKHFDVGTVAIPAFNMVDEVISIKWKDADGDNEQDDGEFNKTTPANRLYDLFGLVFVFDDPDAPVGPPVLSNVAELEKISYKVGDEDAVEVTEIADTITIEIPEYTGDIVVEGVAASNGTVAPATIAVENGVGSGKLVVTAEDGETTKEYTINFIVPLSKQLNKIYNLQVFTGEAVKTDNYGYQTAEEAAGTPNKVVIGENLDATARMWHDTSTTFSYYTPDMEGASYIRIKKHYGRADRKLLAANTKKVVVNGETIVENGAYLEGKTTADTFALDFTQDITYTNIDNKVALNGSLNDTTGIYSFNVSSPCTVVIVDHYGKEYPGLKKYDAETAPDGWHRASGANNWAYSYGTNNRVPNYYKHFEAGDLVKIPGYDLRNSGEDTVDVYTSETEYTTYNVNEISNSNYQVYSFAIKWDIDKSEAALSEIKVNGEAISGFDAEVDEYDVVLPLGATEATISATASLEWSEVAYEETVSTDEAAVITVTAPDGVTTKEYRVNFITTPAIYNITSEDAGVSTTPVQLIDANEWGAIAKAVNILYADYPSENEGEAYDKEAFDAAVAAQLKVYQDSLDAIDAEFGEGANLGTSLLTGYPKALATPYKVDGTTVGTTVKIDNPTVVTDGSIGWTNAFEKGRGFAIQVPKGGTPSIENPGLFGDNDEYIKFNTNAPGIMYIVGATNKDHQGAIDAEFDFKQFETRKIYFKKFDAGVVKVPAWNLPVSSWIVDKTDDEGNALTYKRFSDVPSFFFVFDDIEDATLESITYQIGENEPVEVAVEGNAIEIPINKFTGAINMTYNVSNSAVVSAVDAIEVVDGVGSTVATVKSYDGKATNDYTISFVARSSDATLSALAYSTDTTGEVSVPDFDAETLDYNVELPAGTTSVEVVATKADDKANDPVITQADLNAEEKVATIVVTAEDGTTIKTYTITFTVKAAASPLELKSVKYKTPAEVAYTQFATLEGDGTYSIFVSSEVEAVELLAEAVDNTTIVSYSEEGAIDLVAGIVKSIVVTVTDASDADLYEEYTVNILRALDTEIGGTEDGGEI